MRSIPRLAWLLVLLTVPVLAACGGGGDDDDDDDSGGPSSQGPGSSSQSSSGSNSNSKFDVKLPEIKEANYSSGKVSIEISGDKKVKIDADGNGTAVPGFALLTYIAGDNNASVQIGIQSDDDENPGAVAITHKDVVTTGAWGQDCKVTVTESGGKLNGEFTCDNVDALEPGSTKSLKVKLKGTFSAGP